MARPVLRQRRKKWYTIAARPVTTAGLPLDVAPAAAGYSLRKISRTYGGPCCKVFRSSDSAVQDIGFGSDGLFDAVAWTAFSSSSNSIVWYDQQAANNAVLAPVDYAAKSVFISQSNGLYAHRGGFSGGGPQVLRAPNVSAIQDIWGGAGGGGLMFVVTGSGLQGGVNAISGKGTTSWCWFTFPYDSVNTLWFNYGAGGSWGSQEGFIGSAIHLIEVWYDTSTILTTNLPARFYIDGNLCTYRASAGPAAVASDSDGALDIMNSIVVASEGQSFPGWVYEALVYKGVPANLATLRASLKTHYGII